MYTLFIIWQQSKSNSSITVYMRKNKPYVVCRAFGYSITSTLRVYLLIFHISGDDSFGNSAYNRFASASV